MSEVAAAERSSSWTSAADEMQSVRGHQGSRRQQKEEPIASSNTLMRMLYEKLTMAAVHTHAAAAPLPPHLRNWKSNTVMCVIRRNYFEPRTRVIALADAASIYVSNDVSIN